MSAIVRVNETGATVVVDGAAAVTALANAAEESAASAATSAASAISARDAAIASVGAGNIYLTKAAADAALSGVAANAWVRVQADETQGGQAWFYQKVSGSYVSRGAVQGIGPVSTQTPALVSNAAGIVSHDILAPAGQINGAGGDDAVRVRIASFVNQFSNGPVGQTTYFNTVCGFGSNFNTNWTQINPGIPGASMRIESKFYQESCFGTEFHWSILTTGGDEFRSISAFIPHNASDWATKGGFSIHGSYISLFDGRAQVRHFIDGRSDTWDIVNPTTGDAMQFRFEQNDRAPMSQRNAAGNAFLDLPYYNSRNETQISSALYHVGTRVTNLFGLNGLSASLYVNPQANDVIRVLETGAAVTGNIEVSRDVVQATGAAVWQGTNLSSGGRAVHVLTHNNGIAALGFENFATGSGSFQIRFSHSADATIFDDGSRGNAGATEAFRIAHTTGRVTFAYPPRLPSYTVAGLASVGAAAVGAGAMAYCTNETGGPVLVFSDGTDWRRVTDRAIAS